MMEFLGREGLRGLTTIEDEIGNYYVFDIQFSLDETWRLFSCPCGPSRYLSISVQQNSPLFNKRSKTSVLCGQSVSYLFILPLL